ncbi:hypothetical protein [Pedobacter sandarakinus]|uniref:hypothetical protein n=1 Tax=Pedobacter sandarakinus TaxID=353156 RepID=UPI0022451E40|nr:hypothetical protein [Pedobacter sandarakinus]MCX2575069.1 hypothetical protein [Pedobacter sandarakinus]
MINLKFIEIDTDPIKPKATVHASGRLGFNIDAINFMDLANKNNFRVAVTGEEGEELKNIYLIDDGEYKSSAKVAKSGEYYYLNVGNLFDDLGIDFKNFTVIFDIKKDYYENKEMYVLKMRRLKRKKSDLKS